MRKLLRRRWIRCNMIGNRSREGKANIKGASSLCTPPPGALRPWRVPPNLAERHADLGRQPHRLTDTGDHRPRSSSRPQGEDRLGVSGCRRGTRGKPLRRLGRRSMAFFRPLIATNLKVVWGPDLTHSPRRRGETAYCAFRPSPPHLSDDKIYFRDGSRLRGLCFFVQPISQLI